MVFRHPSAGQPTSRYVGVTWAKHLGKWKAQIRDGGKHVVRSLGCFEQEVTAAKAFDVAARKLRGDEAHGRPCANGVVWRLNFPAEVEQAKYVAWNSTTGRGTAGGPAALFKSDCGAADDGAGPDDGGLANAQV